MLTSMPPEDNVCYKRKDQPQLLWMMVTVPSQQCLAKKGKKVLQLLSPVADGTIYAGVACIIKVVDGNHIEVPNDPGCDGVAPAPRRAHGCHKLHVDQLLEGVVPAVIPVVNQEGKPDLH